MFVRRVFSKCSSTSTRVIPKRNFETSRLFRNENKPENNQNESNENKPENNQKPEGQPEVKSEEVLKSVNPTKISLKITKQLDKKIQELEKSVLELRTTYRTILAETENMRKRMQKDVEKAKEFGVEKLVKDLFSITDTLNICLDNKPNFQDPAHASNSEAKEAFDGLEATKKEFTNTFREFYKLEEFFPPIGETFDPHSHNAITEVPISSLEVEPEVKATIKPGTVGKVFKSGWRRNDNILVR
eukprot:TRINITY_DN6290_c0_g1_i1.p1 TRINITY_DN6290_c0_g1~~TRINITY_DN6290_c0_g1_i1.p1  ORF type:complete len:244 (+),score=36.08 TRINITY_DN6290_c0_g1_i1:27-758(+)